jgi:hypothetical protein
MVQRDGRTDLQAAAEAPAQQRTRGRRLRRAARPRSSVAALPADALLAMLTADMTLSTDLDDPDARPYFLWDQQITYGELRQKLQSPDPDERALWMARVMREARYQDVWRLLRLRDVLALLPRIERHLGRMRGFWSWLIEGWRSDGLLPTGAQ